MIKKTFILIILLVLLSHLYGQIVFDKNKAGKHAEKEATIVLHGQNFKQIKSIDQVEIGEFPIDITSQKIISNEMPKLGKLQKEFFFTSCSKCVELTSRRRHKF